MREDASAARRGRFWLALASLLALAFAARVAGFEQVFVGGGDVVFTTGDPYYHLRRALVSFHDLSRLLELDPYLSFPTGSPVPIPPLWTWTLAGVARIFGRTQAVFEHVAAWLPPLLGAVTLLPTAALARRLAGTRVALGAAAILALLPVHVVYSGIGNPDHHAAEGLLGALLLWLYALALEPGSSARRLTRLHLALCGARIAMLLTWSGSLLHLGVGEAALVLAAALGGSRERLVREGLGALATAVAVAPFALRAVAVGAPLFSSVELTLLQPLAYLVLGAVSFALYGLERARPGANTQTRLARIAALGAIAAVALFATPSLRAGLAEAQAMLTKGNVWHQRAAEQRPLFTFAGGLSAAVGEAGFGLLCWLIPVAPLAALALARDPARRAPALFLAAWSALAGLLALTQLRFGVDYAPAGAIVLALLLAQAGGALARLLRRGPGAAALLAAGLGAALLWPGVAAGPAAYALGSARALARPLPGDRALATADGSLVRFARDVRALTPETAGFLGDGATPEYGILTFVGIGHTFVYEARRPTPGGNFGPYVGPETFEAARTFYAIASEDEAVASAARLRARYVTTNLIAGETPETLLYRLHVEDGLAARGLPRWQHFRLVTEGPRGGVPLATALGRSALPSAVPYKLFEIVRGAEIRVATRPGARVEASVTVATPLGRQFVYRAEALADASGVARLRVPYATRSAAPARPTSAWRVASEGRAVAIAIDEAQVREGAGVDVDLRADAAP